MAESRRDEIAKLEALYASNPDGRVFTHLAEAYRRAGELERAREILDRGLERHPDYPSAHVVLGRVHADLGQGEEAATAFRRVLQLDPENLIARRSLAEAARAAGHDEDALRHYRELLVQDPSASEVREIIDELQIRLHGPAAPPPVMPASWSTSRDEESWDSPGPAATADATSGFEPGGMQATDDADPGRGFGQIAPDQPEPSPFDPEPLDLSGIDFGGGVTRPPEPTATPADTGHEASGWGSWPGQPEQVPEQVPEPVPEQVESGNEAAEAIEPVHTGEPEPFAGRPSVEAPFEEAADGIELDAAPVLEDDRAEAETSQSGYGDGAAETSLHEADETAAASLESAASRLADVAALEDDAGPAHDAPSLESAASGLADVSALEDDAGPAHDTPSYEYDETAAPSHPVAPGEADHVETTSGTSDFDAFGVPTATLAALYEAQGFPDRAASVYRALLRDHPDDARLRERARAADEAAAELRAQRTGIEETREVWVSAESWESGSGPTAYAWDADEDDDVAADVPSIGDYLGRVLSWRPSVETVRAEAVGSQAREAGEAAKAREAAEARAAAADRDRDRDERLVEPWDAGDDQDDLTGHDTLDGFVFGEPVADSSDVEHAGTAAEPASLGPASLGPASFEPASLEPASPESATEVESGEAARAPARAERPKSAPDAGMDIEYGYGLAPGESAFGAHPPAVPPADPALHLDTLLPLPPEEQIEGEPPTTWFDPEPAAGANAASSRPALPFELDETGDASAGTAEPVGEPLPFDFEQIGSDPGYAAAGPLPFDVAALGADVDDEPGEPLPFELDEPEAARAEPLPFEHAGLAPAEPAAGENVLELQEAEAVSEAEGSPAEVWDPTVALADVARRPHARSEPKLRFEGGSRPEPAPAQPDQDEDEDEDLEMFRTWLQSLKR